MADEAFAPSKVKGAKTNRGETGRGNPPVATEKQPTPSAPPIAERPCCCSLRLCLEYVDIREPTGQFLASLWDDHVFMQVTDCQGRTTEFPKDPRHQKLAKGKHVWTEDLARIDPDPANGCKVDCTIAIQVRREPLFNRVLDEILLVEAALRKAMVALSKDTQTLQLLGVAAMPDVLAIQAALAAIGADQALIDDLNARLAALLKTVVGADDTLMREIGVVIDGAAPCRLPDGEDWLKPVLEPRGWQKDPANADRATLDVEIKAHAGEWHLGLALYRVCPPH